MTAETPDHHEQLNQAMEAMGPVLEAFAVLLDTWEGLVSQAKQRGWSDEQSRALVWQMLSAAAK